MEAVTMSLTVPTIQGCGMKELVISKETDYRGDVTIEAHWQDLPASHPLVKALQELTPQTQAA